MVANAIHIKSQKPNARIYGARELNGKSKMQASKRNENGRTRILVTCGVSEKK